MPAHRVGFCGADRMKSSLASEPEQTDGKGRSMSINGYTARHRAMLQAVADGRGELLCGGVPSLCVDGLWCDFAATNDLCRGGLVEAAFASRAGARVRAVLTSSGRSVLGSLVAV